MCSVYSVYRFVFPMVWRPESQGPVDISQGCIIVDPFPLLVWIIVRSESQGPVFFSSCSQCKIYTEAYM